MTKWAHFIPRAWAVIDGVMVDVVGFQIDHELNAIPRASIYLPLGRSTTTGMTSTIHDIAQSLVEQKPVQIWCQMTPTSTSDKSVRGLGLPTGPFKLFDGLTAGSGYVRNNQGVAQYQVTCNHALVRLNQASAFSDSSHPGNPARYSYGALMAGASDTGVVNQAPVTNEGLNWTSLGLSHAYINQANIAKDLWGSSLYPWFQALTSRDGMWVVEQGAGNLKGDQTNAQAAQALALLKPSGKWYKPLQFKTTLAVDVDIATEIANDVSASTFDPSFLAQQTLWDMLIGSFATDYCFAVVPRVSDALVVPYIPGNRGTSGKPFQTIRAEEYVGIQIDAVSRRPLRAYGILSGISVRSGANLTGEAVGTAAMGVGGWYDAKKDGTVMIQGGPRWMNEIISPSSYAAESSGGNLKPVANAANPGAGAANQAADNMVARIPVIKHFLDSYAQYRYAQEVLQGRYGIVSGPLRVDIAPGSLVQIEGASESFIASDQLAANYFGEVLRVSLIFNAETPTIGTAFHIGYVRNPAENASDDTSVAAHPLYQTTFQGAPLLDP